MSVRDKRSGVCIGLLALVATALLAGQQTGPIDASLLTFATWRPLGPAVAGRLTAAAAAGRPGAYLAGLDGAGLWTTTDYGQSWRLLFDPAPVGAVSAIAVAPSTPAVVYVGTGDLSGREAVSATGSGLYRSADAGRTFTPVGAADAQLLTHIAVDPANADILLFAVSGPNVPGRREAGLYRSLDGGRTAQRLSLDTRSGAVTTLLFDRASPANAFAAIDGATATDSGIFKSTDGGLTWRRLPIGAPLRGDARRIAVAATMTGRLYALVSHTTGATLVRSDDAGESWQVVNAALSPRADEPMGLAATGAATDILYLTGGGRVQRSMDGGRTFVVWHTWTPDTSPVSIWPHATSPDEVLVSTDRGPSITVNGGDSWSTHTLLVGGDASRLATDGAFPYRVCGLITARGVVCGPSHGVTSSVDWSWLGADVVGPIAPDPLDGDVLYTEHLARFDRGTGQASLAGPAIPDYARTGATDPAALAYSSDGRTLFAGLRSIWRLTAVSPIWSEVSPDLVGAPNARITRLATSAIDPRRLWAGTSTGAIHTTRDGGTTWSLAAATGGGAVVALELSRFDPNAAYVTVADSPTATRLMRTRDGGTTWTDIGRVLPAGAQVRSVREDVFRRGLLAAATDRSVFFSIDDGESWQSIKGNLPNARVTDIAIRDADLVVSTAGRGFWILDDFSPLRELTADVARADSFLFRPAQTWRMRATSSSDAPAVATGDGVALSYLVGPTLTGAVTIEIIETLSGDLIRRYSSDPDRRQAGDPLLTRSPGLHRVVWDLRYSRPEADLSAPAGARVLPGTFQARLTTATRSIRQSVAVRLDPRVRATPADLTAQRALARRIDATRADLARAIETRGPNAALVASRDELRRVAQLIDGADTRPSEALDAAATAALARAAAGLPSEPAR